MRDKPLQTYLIFCFNSFSSQIASHCKGVFGFGTKPLSDGIIFSGASEFFARFEHSVFNPLDQHKHFVQIFLRFSRQTDHHIKFDGQHSAIKNRAANINNFIICQIFINDAAANDQNPFPARRQFADRSIQPKRRAIHRKFGLSEAMKR